MLLFKKRKYNEIEKLSSMQVASSISFPALIDQWSTQVESIKLDGSFLDRDKIKIQRIGSIANKLNQALLLLGSDETLAKDRSNLNTTHISALIELSKNLNIVLDEMLAFLSSPQVYKSVPRIKKIAPSDMPLSEVRNGANVILNPLAVAVKKLKNEISGAKNALDAFEVGILDLKKDVAPLSEEETRPRFSRVSSSTTFRST